MRLIKKLFLRCLEAKIKKPANGGLTGLNKL